MKTTEIPYKDIFNKIEATLKKQSFLSDEDFDAVFGEYKDISGWISSENDYFKLITETIFYSGFRAEIVANKLDIIENYFKEFNEVATYNEKKIREMMNDPNMVKHEGKIRACINNAKILKSLIEEYGSFKKYIEQFEPEKSFENLMILKEDLECRFDYLGDITTYQFMADIGLPVLKPDRVLRRIFKRIGLIKYNKQFLMTIIQGRRFSYFTGHPIRYIDICFVKYGQIGEEERFGLKDGICLEKNPRCNICGIQEYCNYYVEFKIQ